MSPGTHKQTPRKQELVSTKKTDETLSLPVKRNCVAFRPALIKLKRASWKNISGTNNPSQTDRVVKKRAEKTSVLFAVWSPKTLITWEN